MQLPLPNHLNKVEWFQCFSVQELKFQLVPYLEMGGSLFFCLGTESSKGSLLRNGWFQCFPVQEQKVPKIPYLEMGDRKSVVQGKSVDLGGRRIIKKKKNKK